MFLFKLTYFITIMTAMMLVLMMIMLYGAIIVKHCF